MKELLSTITSKGQITIPAEIRDSLGLKQGDKVAFVIEDHQVLLRRTGSVVASTAGSLRTDRPSLSAEHPRAAAEEAIAEETSER
ncbi:MAG TPA: AbrB/MazE/SpoVT family DNA-binding domain-containing protein [Ktedonobacterales bacterium]|nr:AbrB/MazE/SpoVT family DNA-binding domain-containing protein [Ktedonobacterales bacterium]